MKSIKMAGLCLVAAFAFSAVAAASALAEGQPSFKACVKAEVKNTGAYEDKACTTKSVTSTGKYELAEVAPGTKFTGKSKTTTIAAKSKTGATENIVCGKDSVAGEITGTSTLSETVTFSKCKANGSKTEPCENAGKETIKTEIPFGEFYWINSGETLPGVLTTPPVTIFKCGGEEVELQGELIGEVENGAKTLNFNYALSGGAQQYEAFFIEGSEFGPFFTGYEKEGEIGILHESTVAGKEELKIKGVSVR